MGIRELFVPRKVARLAYLAQEVLPARPPSDQVLPARVPLAVLHRDKLHWGKMGERMRILRGCIWGFYLVYHEEREFHPSLSGE